MVNSKDFAFKVNKQTPANGSLPPAYGTVMDCRPACGKRGMGEKEVKSRQVRLTRVPGPDGVECRKRKRQSKDARIYDGDASPGKDATADAMSTATASTSSLSSSSNHAPSNHAPPNTADVKTPLNSKTPPPSVPSHSPEETPFDFQSFLDQMKTKSAEPVARYLRRLAESP